MKTTTQKPTVAKQCYDFANGLGIDWRELLGNIEDLATMATDFEVDNYRFIHSDSIDAIMRDELESDLYVLGCFNAWFIAEVTGIDIDVIEAMQKAEAFEAIGKLIISLDKLEELQEQYAWHDGYGHHFAHYDFETGELYINDQLYYYFRID